MVRWFENRALLLPESVQWPPEPPLVIATRLVPAEVVPETRRVGWPVVQPRDLPVLMISSYDNPTYVARAVALGASGYLLKSSTGEELVEAIRTVAAGESVWKREALRRMTGALATPRLNVDVEVPLTQRESEVLQQMALGLTNKEIAQVLGISYETVKEHVQHVLRKVGVADRTQASVWAVRSGLV